MWQSFLRNDYDFQAFGDQHLAAVLVFCFLRCRCYLVCTQLKRCTKSAAQPLLFDFYLFNPDRLVAD